MSAKITSTAFLLFAASALGAQTPAPTYIVSRLGVDTIAVERFTRTPNKLEGDIALRFARGGPRLYHYVAGLGPRGEITSMRTIVRRPGADPATPAIVDIGGNFADSVAVFEVTRAGQRDTVGSGRKIYHGPVAPTLGLEPPPYGPYEQILASSKLGNDSVVYALVSPGAGPIPNIILRRRDANTVAFTSTFFPGWVEVAKVDSRGRILSVDATATTVKTKAERVSSLAFDNIVNSWMTRGPVVSQMSPPDTVRANVAGANIEVAYSRPGKRGRQIFGNIVPWNEVWRTGANAATQLTTDKEIAFGTTVLPAGKYTLWTLPTPTGAKLIINSETGQWGTDYHAEKDVGRVDLTTTTLSRPVEAFTIGVAPQGSGGVLRMAWDDREFSVPFTVR
ncbi:MAG TPA: DUF2911 domain-containing protein [Gemmatimonadaceae bacterium]|nr:DUF2911 domain-containing protein [Gemmatimonadaceae bacterium]